MSYAAINSKSCKLIKAVHAIGSRFPSPPYDAEWEAVGRGKDPKLYLPFTHVEFWIPWVFAALQRVASILACAQVDVTSATQTNPSSRPQMCIMRDGSCTLKPAVYMLLAIWNVVQGI